MNVNSENIGELAGNQSILDKKKENTSKVSFLKENIKGQIVFSHLIHKLVSLPEIINTFECTN